MPGLSKLSNRWLALIVGAVLFAIAGAFIYFVHPGGFETQMIWTFLLLPGTLPAEMVSLLSDKAPNRVAEILFDAEFLLFNLLFYWVVGYVIVRMARRWKQWDGF